MAYERRQHSVWKNLFLVRHGESTANEINRFAGTIDAPLTDLGRAQASRAGNGWQSGQLDRVYVSPLQRARETADILLGTPALANHTPLPITPDSRLSERHFGDFTLKNKTRLQRRFGLRSYEAALYREASALHGGEEFSAFRQRVLSFLKNEIYPQLRDGKRVLVVAHKYVIELLTRLILRLPEGLGRDLRLPNAQIIGGANLRRYVRRESPLRNWFSDLVVVHHSAILALAAVIGLLLNAAGATSKPPTWLPLLLLGAATTIALARVSLSKTLDGSECSLFAVNRLGFRFVVLPWLVTGGLIAAAQIHEPLQTDALLGFALLLAAPTAVTAIVLSRTSGGMILPTVMMVLLSTTMSLANIIVLLAFFGQTDLTMQAFMLVAVSSISLLLPALLVYISRRRFPIFVAKAAEDHAALSVLALAIFVILSFQQISLSSFYPNALIAIAAGIALRLVALRLARHRSLYGIDDYFAYSYPNIFLVIILAGLLDNTLVLELATWFLVPMFALAPLDDLLIKRLRNAQTESSLLSYMRVAAPTLGLFHSAGEYCKSAHHPPRRTGNRDAGANVTQARERTGRW